MVDKTWRERLHDKYGDEARRYLLFDGNDPDPEPEPVIAEGSYEWYRREVERLRKELTDARASVDLWKDGVTAAGHVSDDHRQRAEQAEAELAALKADTPGDVISQIDKVEAERAAMPEEERLRREAADAPLLRLQLAGWYRQAKEAQAAIERAKALHAPFGAWCVHCDRDRDVELLGNNPACFHKPRQCSVCGGKFPCSTLASLSIPAANPTPAPPKGDTP